MTEPSPRWQIRQARQVEKVLRRLSQDLVKRMDRAILALAEDPRPRGCKRLKGTGQANLYRIRVGNWRISYAVEDDLLIILILEVAPRGGAYRF